MKFKVAALALLAGVSTASAADMSRPYTKAPAAAAQVYNWTGFYIGAQGGYGSAELGLLRPKGGFGGGTIGYNWQFSPNWVFGIEGEGAGASLRETRVAGLGVLAATVTDTVEAFGSISGRLGYTWGAVMIYGKGGFGAASNRISATALGVTVADTRTHTGGTGGGGIEWKFAPSWSVKGEYLYASYSGQTYFAGIVPGGVQSGTLNVHTGKVGINYHFNWGGPVVAKY